MFDLVGVSMLVIALIMMMFVLLSQAPIAIIGLLLCIAASITTFKAKNYYLEYIDTAEKETMTDTKKQIIAK